MTMQNPLVCRILSAGILLATTLEVEVRAQIVSKVPGPFGWKKSVPLHLILDKGVVNDLGLSPETTRELNRLHEQIQAEVEELRRAPANNPQFAPRKVPWVAHRPWNDELLHTVRNRYTERINELLSPQQQERLHQIHVQVQPKPTTDVLLDPGVAKELGLSVKQRDDIYQRHYEVVRAEIDEGKQGRKYTGPRYGQLELEVPEKVLNLLTPEQRQRFEQLGGKPFQPADPKAASSDAALSNSETLTLAFDELEADGLLRNALGWYPAEQYREKYSLWMGSCQLRDTPEVGKNVVLAGPIAAFEVLGGRDQPFISPQNVIVPAGGETYDLLLTFERPVTAVSIVSDPYPETADVIRLLILEPVPTVNGTATTSPSPEQVACRVLALDRKFDNARTAPDNLLSVDLKGKPFHHVLIECTTEREAFDNLRFTRAIRDDQEPSAVPPAIFDWKKVRESQPAAAVDDRAKVAAAIETQEITVGDLKLSVPKAWKRRQSKSETRLAEYEVPPVEGDKQPGEFVVSYDQGQEGDPKRDWDGMVRGFERPQLVVREGGSRVGFYELVDITGTYNKPVDPPDQGKSERLDGWRGAKVYLNWQNVKYVVKIDGPAKTVEAHLDGLRATFGGDAKKEREWR